MNNNHFLENVRNFFINQMDKGKNVNMYHFKDDVQQYFKDMNIKVAIDQYKEVILEEETEIELGGFGRSSFSLIYPIEDDKMIIDGKITVLGPELNVLSNKQVDFGMFLLIGVQNLTESTYRNLNIFSLLSNGIEGFSIRTIPRRFWCRISHNLMKKNFNLEFFGNAIIYLYKSKFKETIKSLEIFFIISEINSIQKFLDLTSQIRLSLNQLWMKKVDEWKKRIDCEYDWGCEICPYQTDCQEIKDLLNARNKLES